MRAVVQRVLESSVEVDGQTVGKIDMGLTVLIGIDNDDDLQDAKYMAEKISGLRIFEDDKGKMNLSIIESRGSILAISQFTLYGDVRKGKRPSFIKAALPEKANILYLEFIKLLKEYGIEVELGVFQAEMKVSILNDGPVTILIDSKKSF